MNILIGTKNQKKITIVQSVFTEVLSDANISVSAHHADSQVPEAPHNKETYQGALNRATECASIGGADYYVGIESGLVERYGNMFEEAWAVIIPQDGTPLVGYSSGLILPQVVSTRMKNGEKHNEIMNYYDTLFDLPDDNRDTWSRYTGGVISREVSLAESVRNALIQTVASDRNLYKML